MSDYYTSAIVQPLLPLTARGLLALEFLTASADSEPVPEDLVDCIPAEWLAEVEGRTFLSDEMVDAFRELSIASLQEKYFLYFETSVSDVSAEILQWLLKNFMKTPVSYCSIEGAHTCSRMMPDGFGGVACVISHDSIDWMNTGRWIADFVAAQGLDKS